MNYEEMTTEELLAEARRRGANLFLFYSAGDILAKKGIENILGCKPIEIAIGEEEAREKSEGWRQYPGTWVEFSKDGKVWTPRKDIRIRRNTVKRTPKIYIQEGDAKKYGVPYGDLQAGETVAIGAATLRAILDEDADLPAYKDLPEGEQAVTLVAIAEKKDKRIASPGWFEIHVQSSKL